MFQWARNLIGGSRPTKSERPQARASGTYDNARTTDENKRSWWGVDYMSARAANSFAVRRVLRGRSRHEVANNPYLFGIANSNADDLIDTGPTLQILTSKDEYNRQVERAWREWCDEVDLTEKLRTVKLAKTIDGEGFLVLKTVEDLEHPVKLYPCDIEADQVTNPSPQKLEDWFIDGITLHPTTGQPVIYHVLKHHPGDFFFPDFNPLSAERVTARWVIHWFHKYRPGQVRGVPVFTPSLDLFNDLRSFRRAVLNNAHLVAAHTVLLEQDMNGIPAGSDDDANKTYQPFVSVPIDRGMQAVLPPGMKAQWPDAKQPATTYEMFQEKCLGEACRPLNYPLNLALGTSQKFNFSSAKLDHINYRNGLRVEREDCNKTCLRILFRAWYLEAIITGVVPPFDGIRLPPHQFQWPGFEPLDAVADATADHQRLAAGTDTWRDFWARRGRDYRDVLRQQAAEQAEIEELGVKFGEPVTRTEQAVPAEAANVA